MFTTARNAAQVFLFASTIVVASTCSDQTQEGSAVTGEEGIEDLSAQALPGGQPSTQQPRARQQSRVVQPVQEITEIDNEPVSGPGDSSTPGGQGDSGTNGSAGGGNADPTDQDGGDDSIPEVPQILIPAIQFSVSNTANLTISGLCTTDNLVHLGGMVVESEVVNPVGRLQQVCRNAQFEFVISKPMDAVYDFTIVQEHPNSTRRSTPANISWHRDTTPPPAPGRVLPATDFHTSGDSSLIIAGSCEIEATVYVASSYQQMQLCTGEGLYSFTSAQTTDGTYAYAVYQIDLAGNRSEDSSITWVRDTTLPPTPSITSPAASIYRSNSSVLTISGACADSHQVVLGGDILAAQVISPVGHLDQFCSDGGFSYTVQKSIDGVFTFNLLQINQFQIESVASTLLWYRDATPPAALILNLPAENPVVASGSLVIDGSCEAGATVELSGSSEQSAVCSAGGHFSYTVVKTVDGLFNFSLSQIDLAGNRSSAREIQWQRDSGVPATPAFTLPAQEIFSSNQTTLNLSGTCVANYTVVLSGEIEAQDSVSPAAELTQVCSENGTFSYTLQKSTDGQYQVLVAQHNGGRSSAAASRIWVLDRTAPVITLGERPTDPNLARSSAVNFTVDDGLATIQCKLDTGSYANCSSPFTLTNLANGLRTVSIKGSDAAGNTTEEITYSWNQAAYNTIALYHFDGSGYADSSSYPGAELNTLNNSATVATTTKKFGDTARDFESTSSSYLFVTDNKSQDLPRSTLTAEAWVNFESLPSSGGYMTVMSKMGLAGNYGWQFRIKRGSFGRYCLAFQGSLDGSTLTEKLGSCVSMSTGRWYHVAATWDRGSVRFYIDGVSRGSGTIGTAGSSILHATTADLRIGSVSTGGSYFDGKMDEVRLSQTVRWTSGFSLSVAPYVAD